MKSHRQGRRCYYGECRKKSTGRDAGATRKIADEEPPAGTPVLLQDQSAGMRGFEYVLAEVP
jgi:hypothetical protein